jgi:hypothetical protein
MMKSVLKPYADLLEPLNKPLGEVNEFWHTRYYGYDPKGFRISSYGGGCYFYEHVGQGQGGYIPMWDITTCETHGYTLIELNHQNAQRLYEEHPHVYDWLEYLVRQQDQKNFLGFDPENPDPGQEFRKKYCHGIGSETSTGQHVGELSGHKNKLVLCFGTGGGESYDQQLLTVIRIKGKKDDERLIWEFLAGQQELTPFSSWACLTKWG